MNRIAENFGCAASFEDEKSAFKKHFRVLKDEMRFLAKKLSSDGGDPTHLNPIEKELKAVFKNFLSSMNYQLALENFNILLDEKSGDKFFREDGSVNWYHEFLPIFELLTMASQGKNNGGFDMEDLEAHGGLEMLITTHLRHDSKEDFKTLGEIKVEQKKIIANLCNTTPKYANERNKPWFVDMLINNIDHISQIRVDDGSPKGKKESLIQYLSRIITNPKSNPIILLCKMADIGHNLATLLGAAKFTPEKRLKICNGREDMFGSRQGYTEEAIERWPEIKAAIKTLDCSMGVTLYPHFKYLTNVDLYYKEPAPGRVGIGKYLKAALRLDIPEAYNKIHISFKRMAASVPKSDVEKYERLKSFMDDVIKPALQKYSTKFPYLFGSNDNKPGHSAAPTLPKGGVYAPNMR